MSHFTMTSDKRILITGATGLLCADVVPVLSEKFDCVPTGFSQTLAHPNFRHANLRDANETCELLEQVLPDVIIHTAALANVDQCEKEPYLAHALTVQTTKNLTDWINTRSPDCLLVYISSDQVYAGDGPHSEDNVSPRNVYALTKLWAEDIARTTNRHLVLRTNFFGLGAEKSGGFANWLINAFKTGENITLFDDVLFNPLYSKDLADWLCRLISSDIPGTYNLGASCDGMSKAEFGKLLAAATGLSDKHVKIGKIDDLELAAWRPRDMRTSVEKLTQASGISLPTVRDGLKRLAGDWSKLPDRKKHGDV
jgi:dTDP-4-dehydrorhamnose reductase